MRDDDLAPREYLLIMSLVAVVLLQSLFIVGLISAKDISTVEPSSSAPETSIRPRARPEGLNQ